MFTGFFRYDEVAEVQKRDVEVSDDHMVIFLPRSKMDVLREGDRVRIARTHLDTCPVAALVLYMEEASVVHDGEYLFRAIVTKRSGDVLRKTNDPISYDSVRRSFLGVLRQVGIDSSRLGLHSMRAGGATKAANAGVADRVFQRHGRWKSTKAKDGYVVDDFNKVLSVSKILTI